MFCGPGERRLSPALLFNDRMEDPRYLPLQVQQPSLCTELPTEQNHGGDAVMPGEMSKALAAESVANNVTDMSCVFVEEACCPASDCLQWQIREHDYSKCG